MTMAEPKVISVEAQDVTRHDVNTTLQHDEQWNIVVTPANEGDWPDRVNMSWNVRAREFKPDRLVINLRRGMPEPQYRLHGRPWLADGRHVGESRVSVAHRALPEWARQLAEAVRAHLDLGPGKTGVSW